MPQTPISLCVITRDEARNIEACLQSVPFAADIVVVDSGSTDDTRARAERLGARVIEEPFRGHVAQKAYAVSLAEHEWVLCLDADERLSEELEQEIRELLSGEPDASAYVLRRRNFYLGRWIRHGGWADERRVRLFDRRHAHWAGTDPHDRVETDRPPANLKGFLDHYNYRDMRHHLEKVNAYTSTMAQRRIEKGEGPSLSSLLFRPPARFFKMYIIKRGFLDGWRGFVLAVIGAFYVFLKYAKIFERHKVPDDSGDGS